MVQVKGYQLPPTPLIPNSPRPVLHYPRFLSLGFLSSKSNEIAIRAYDLFSRNGWQTQWIYRYGPTQDSHYHSDVHECMVVLSGSATIRFGVADIADEYDLSEDRGIEVPARAGDVFVIPAGVAHKTFDTAPSLPLKLLTPGDGHKVDGEDQREVIAKTELSGFTMMGAYPEEGGVWDFLKGGDHIGNYKKVWSVAKPRNDPVLGDAGEGLYGLWM